MTRIGRHREASRRLKRPTSEGNNLEQSRSSVFGVRSSAARVLRLISSETLHDSRFNLFCQVLKKFPHISGYCAWRLPVNVNAKKLLKSQLALSATDGKHQSCILE